MANPIPLQHGYYYHIYNKGINGINLFYENKNYEYFLKLYEKYIDPIADTFAWCLMPNHFHLLVRIKEEKEIKINQLSNSVRVWNPDRVENNEGEKKVKSIHLYFSDLFNAYCQAINKQEHRTGSLFQRPFKRKQIEQELYFKQLVMYIHNNPVKHGFADCIQDYPWSSYGNIISLTPTTVQRDMVLGWFNSRADFIEQHTGKPIMDNTDYFMIE